MTRYTPAPEPDDDDDDYSGCADCADQHGWCRSCMESARDEERYEQWRDEAMSR